MSSIAPLADAATDWDAVAADLAPIRTERALAARKRKSRDYYWFSPLLKTALESVLADVVAIPATIDEVSQVAAYCVSHRLPLTVRGGGTGNYGQAMPLRGGVVLDMSALDAILHVDRETVRAQAGAKLIDLERAAEAHDRELRFHPSTWKSATVAGFVAGGSSGCGAINYGTLHSPGNVAALTALTLGDTPEIVELRGAEAQALVHAYGTNAIILEVELALAPKQRWHDRIVAVPDLETALELIDAIGRDEVIAKKELALLDAAACALVRPVGDLLEEAENALIAMIAEKSLPEFEALVGERGGRIAFARDPDTRPARVPPMYELGWNHTTLHAIGRDAAVSYMQCLYPADYRPVVLAIADELGAEVPTHLELARLDGEIACFGLPLLRFTSAERLEEIHTIFRRHGCTVFNPHTFVLETGGLQIADPAQLAFRRRGDPFGLLNPGKMPGWDVPATPG